MMIFTVREKIFVTIIGQSSFRNPYQTHRLKPLIRISSIKTETCEAFFSWNIFMSCGNMDVPVNTPAAIPTIFVIATAKNIILHSFLYIYKKARRNGLTLTPKPYCLWAQFLYSSSSSPSCSAWKLISFSAIELSSSSVSFSSCKVCPSSSATSVNPIVLANWVRPP